MSDPPTPLTLPPTLPYPITITRLLVRTGDSVERGSHLLEYSFMSKEQRAALSKRETEGRKANISKGEVEGDDGSGTWDCLITGEVAGWESWVQVGTKLERRHANQTLINVVQPCSHPVRLHGMCGICGADLTEDDYLSAPAPVNSSEQAGPSRHPGGFEVTHDAMGVTVSKNEAHRLDNLTRDNLLSSRKLSLIVDLDQTIIHTTVDPTVAEWMDEIDAYNRQESSSPSRSSSIDQPEYPGRSTGPSEQPNGADEKESTTPPTSPPLVTKTLPPESSPSPTRLEKNPNSEALSDVARFQIADDLPPGYVKPRRKPGESIVQMQGRWYFTKPRPGLQKFLDEMSEIYEMHVYTMGTRSYADAICKVIDPDGKIFGGRILSRDESGSFSSKNLKRLFPTDTSMVVVIDDRSDVWADCPNLVKVVPYDFFIGIGDINSSFLPKNKSTPPPSATATASTPTSPSLSASDASTPPPATPEDLPSVEDGLLMKAKLLDDLSESRPLAKMQEELEQVEGDGREVRVQNDSPTVANTTAPVPSTPSTPPRPRKPLLNPNDYELLRVSDILREIHHRFYRAFDSLDDWDTGSSLPMSCDVEFIIPELKSRVLDGCNLVFSGLIPQAANPETTEIWQTAETFGALCSLSVHPRITHCVTATLNTEKTYRTSRIPGAQIVWANWFWDSVALWHRQDESKYLAKKEGRSRTTTPPLAPPPLPSQSGITDGTNGSSSSSGEQQGESLKPSENPDDLPTTTTRNGEEEDDHENMDDDAEVGKGWDEGADAEWEAFLAEEDDVDLATENGSVKSVDSAPSTPSKKRVRYADEESLPLEDFKDPSPLELDGPMERFSPDDQPAKRRKPLLLQAPSESDRNQIPAENRFQYNDNKHKDKTLHPNTSTSTSTESSQVEDQPPTNSAAGTGAGTDADAGDDAGHSGKDADEHSIAGTEGTEATEGTEEDEFAMMLMDSLANEDGEGEEDEGDHALD
uniref:RNA polymerase II subunit A C-terminal domain phosphatase n=1 Tax=Kwoniella dejecticola CBS 10117 TaxID=1296121 RepID=A0A1A5ZYG0_9TREE|nr:uncharacterized protein I303_06401 [Kwoniella dejecticola CBS 10117]OBR82844.1 hypothetical protein I303_06401 [Kwoniella dejecticola CBS 10117]